MRLEISNLHHVLRNTLLLEYSQIMDLLCLILSSRIIIICWEGMEMILKREKDWKEYSVISKAWMLNEDCRKEVSNGMFCKTESRRSWKKCSVILLSVQQK